MGKAALKGGLPRHLAAAALVIVAFLAWELLSASFGTLPPFITFYPAVMLTATLFGFFPGAVATVLATVLTAGWILPPPGQPRIERGADVLALLIFLTVGIFVSAVSGLHRRSRQRNAGLERDQAVQETVERLRLALHAASAGVWEWNLQTNENTWSEELWKIYGLEPHSCTPSFEAWRQTVLPVDRARVEQAVRDAAARGKEMSVEWRVRDRDGATRWLMSRGRPLLVPGGAAARYAGIVLDITDQKRAEEALRRYELVASNSRDVILFLRGDGRILEANLAAVVTYGYTHDELLGLSILGLCAPEGAELAAAQMAKADAGGVMFETIHRRKDGSTFPVEVSSQGADIAGERTLVSVIRDITRRKLDEEALRASEQRLRTVLENSRDGINLLDLETGKYTFISPAQAELTGFTADELQGMSREEALSRVHPDDREISLQQLSDVVAGRDLGKTAEYRWKVKSGEYRWFADSRRLVRDAHGQPTALVGVSRDVTERRASEEVLELVIRLYVVLSRVNEAIVRVRPEQLLYEEVCRIVADGCGFPLVWVGLIQQREVAPVASWGSAKDYLRETRVEVDGELGQGPTGTCVREDRPVINDDFGTNPSTGPWRELALKHGLRASAAFPLHCNGQAVGALTFYAVRAGAFTSEQVALLESLCADISFALDAMQQERLRGEAERSLRESERNLREVDQRKNEFLGMLSHELRNPLAPLRNSLYILEQAAPGSEQAARARGVIRRQSDHLARLVDDLLDVTRITQGKIELRRERVDVREVVGGVAEDFRPVMEGRALSFQVVVSEAPAWVDADSARLIQIVGNLLNNAAKFTRAGDEVTLSLRASMGEVEISVSDTGPGIDAALIPRIFDSFVQGQRTLARSEGGLGLGLALVKGLTSLHGGTVSVESGGAGMGARFTVRLPLADPPREAEGKPGAGAGRRGPSRRVLVVDDNHDVAESMVDLMEMLGHTAEVAYDGESAIARARAFSPDVVFCDIGLPGMSGYEVARALHSIRPAGMQLVALSGYTRPEDLKAAAEAGFDHHLAKPPDLAELERLLG